MSVTVLKLGGSVLTGRDGYASGAEFLRKRIQENVQNADERFVVVVSAEYGHTDALFREAKGMNDDDGAKPDAALLDLLWSTGELRSVALLSLRLRSIGINAGACTIHETGLRVVSGTDRITFNPIALRAALAIHRVVVVPGFLAIENTRVTTLGRGGSDWSAVLLAASLGATRCELVKDVDGYFTSDPATNSDAELIPQLNYTTALQMADEGCPLVQRHAVAEAARARLPLVIRSLTSHGTTVSL